MTVSVAKSGPQAELNEQWQLLLEYTAWERYLPVVGFQILMCMSLCVCTQRTINALWIPIAQRALKWHLIQLEDYIAPLRLNAKKQRGTKVPFVKKVTEKGRGDLTEGKNQHSYISAAQLFKALFPRVSLPTETRAEYCPSLFSWPRVIDQHSFSPTLWCWSFDSRHMPEGVGLLYKCWQIVVLCQARVCVSTRAHSYGWGATWAHDVIKPGACVLSKCQFTPVMSTSERARSACSWNHSTSSN